MSFFPECFEYNITTLTTVGQTSTPYVIITNLTTRTKPTDLVTQPITQPLRTTGKPIKDNSAPLWVWIFIVLLILAVFLMAIYLCISGCREKSVDSISAISDNSASTLSSSSDLRMTSSSQGKSSSKQS